MKIVVIYQSKTGFTKKYAELISDTLNCENYSRKESKHINLEEYELVIYGGSLYASGILGFKKFKKRLQNQKIIVFAVGASPAREGLNEEIINANFNESEKGNAIFFYMRGGFKFDSLNIIDKGLMLMMKKSIQKKAPKERTADERGLLNAYDTPVDFTREKNIEPLINYVKEVHSYDKNVY